MKNRLIMTLALGALTLSTACGDSTPLLFELGHAPRAVVGGDGPDEYFTGELAPPDFSDTEDVSVLREAYVALGSLQGGQPITTIKTAPDSTVEVYGAPGVFTIGAAVEVVGDQDVTLESITLSYGFDETSVEFERSLSQTLRMSAGRVAVDVDFVDGLDELDTLSSALDTMSMNFGASVITIPVTVTIVGSSTTGDSVRSNALVFPITMCANCADVETTPYALGSRPQ